jgi:tRNA (guanine-N7-)-methyltransferase
MKLGCFSESHIVKTKILDYYPINWEQIFNRDAPLAIEIGFGNGEFLENWASRIPNWNLVGIEYSISSVERMQKRLIGGDISNVRLIKDNAIFALAELFHDNSVEKIVLHFPDPWPKERHSGRRLLSSQFVEILAAILKQNCIFELMTDQEWYADEVRALFKNSRLFSVSKIQTNPNRPINTKYERKWKALKRKSFHLQAKKQRNFHLNRILGDTFMPNMVIPGKLNTDTLSKLINYQYFDSDTFFVVKEIYGNIENSVKLIHVITKDNGYKQDFYIKLINRKNDVVVKLDKISLPYRTAAVKSAINKIGELLSTS